MPEVWVIQEGKWFSEEKGRDVIRYRQPGEDSPIAALRYIYEIAKNSSGKGRLSSFFAYYLPANLRKNYSQLDLRQFFPPLPTHAQYQESLTRQQQERQHD